MSTGSRRATGLTRSPRSEGALIDEVATGSGALGARAGRRGASRRAALKAPLAGRPRPPRRARLGWLDWVLLGGVLLAVGWVAYRLQTRLHYRWNWFVVLDFAVRIDPETGRWHANLLVQGLLTTIRLAIWGAVSAAVIGVVLGLCRVSGDLFLRLVSQTYVEIIRSVPPLVIIFIFYFFISSQIIPLIGVEGFLRGASPTTRQVVTVLAGPTELVPAFLSAMLCLALFEAAYVAEIVRAGIESVERGQWEAAASLGLSWAGTMRGVVLPVAIQRVVPPLASQFISLVKDSSIASLISVQELAFMAAQVSASTSRVFEVWLTASAMYFGLCLGLAALFARLERRMAWVTR
jgi:polar amino acid transport system permease protein